MADARVVHRGKSVVFMEGALFDEDGNEARHRYRDGTDRAATGSRSSAAVSAHVRVTDEPLVVERLTTLVGRPGAGAIVSFQGTTRDVERLEYEAYREMAEQRMASIVGEAIERHGLEVGAPRIFGHSCQWTHGEAQTCVIMGVNLSV